MNCRTFLAVGGILLATPILASEFTQPPQEESVSEFQCALIAWGSTQTPQYGSGSPMDLSDAESWLLYLRQTWETGEHGVYHFLVPVECDVREGE